MGLRFRKSFKIAPGVRWNVGLRGSSFSLGRRGASLNFSKRGVRSTVGIPGTGLSYSRSLTTAEGRRSRAAAPAAPTVTAANPDALGIRKTPWKLILGIVSVVMLFVFFWAGVLGLIFTIALPSRQALANRELQRRLEQFQAAVATLQNSHAVSDIVRVLALPSELRLPEELTNGPVEELHAIRELATIEEAGGQLVSVEGATAVLGPEACYFFAPVFLDKRGKDEHGTVYFGQSQLTFIGESRIEIGWPKVASAKREGRALVLQRSDRQTPYKFVFEKANVAVRSEWVAGKLTGSQAVVT